MSKTTQKHYPVARHHENGQYPRRHNYQKHRNNQGLFQGNLANSMHFGGKDHELSGYIQRTLVMKDRNGNIQIAKEKQFFNSAKTLGRVRIKDNDERD